MNELFSQLSRRIFDFVLLLITAATTTNNNTAIYVLVASTETKPVLSAQLYVTKTNLIESLVMGMNSGFSSPCACKIEPCEDTGVVIPNANH